MILGSQKKSLNAHAEGETLRKPSGKMMTSLSLVVPTLNAGEDFAYLLEALQKQSVVPDDVLIIDSESDDNTLSVVGRFENIRTIVIPRGEFDHGATRHQAFLETVGEIVLFMTQDAIPADEFCIERLIQPFAIPNVAMTYGRQLPKLDARRFEQLVREFNYPEKPNIRSKEDIPHLGIKTFFASDVCSAYRRSAYFACGGFERPCNTNEDMLMAAKFIHADLRVAYASTATVLHSHNLTPREQYLRNKEVGVLLVRGAHLLQGVSEIGEGKRLVAFVVSSLIKERKILEIVAFGVDCAARLLGNKAGRILASRQARKVRS